MKGVPEQGEIWLARLDPTVGPEQSGRRLVLVFSRARFNREDEKTHKTAEADIRLARNRYRAMLKER